MFLRIYSLFSFRDILGKIQKIQITESHFFSEVTTSITIVVINNMKWIISTVLNFVPSFERLTCSHFKVLWYQV